MKKLCILVAAVLFAAPSLSAQITDGQPSAKTIRTGNRPQAGTFGLYVGATSDIVYNAAIALQNPSAHFVPMPLINFKYMVTDKFEVRAGLECLSEGESKNWINADKKYASKGNTTDFMIYPGIAYHFNTKNILDVYVGAELPLGGWSETSKSVSDNTWEKQSQGAFNVGLGAFVGLQAFVANLPFAIGLEYGLSASGSFGGQIKNVAFDGTDKQVKYSAPASGTPQNVDKLRMSKGIFGQQVRLTFAYYFK